MAPGGRRPLKRECMTRVCVCVRVNRSGRVRVLCPLSLSLSLLVISRRTGKQMLDLVRAFVGSPLSTFRYLSLPTESLLVSHISPFHPPSSVQLFTALSIRRYSRHPRRHLSPPCPYARLFSGLS